MRSSLEQKRCGGVDEQVVELFDDSLFAALHDVGADDAINAVPQLLPTEAVDGAAGVLFEAALELHDQLRHGDVDRLQVESVIRQHNGIVPAPGAFLLGFADMLRFGFHPRAPKATNYDNKGCPGTMNCLPHRASRIASAL